MIALKKQIFSFFIAVMMVFASFVIPASAEVYEDKFSDGLYWSLDTKTGVLTISGEGKMDTEYSGEPWRDYDGMFTSVVIEEGVTSISRYAFAKMYSIESISIPTTMESIGFNAFSHLTGLQYVNYAGTEEAWSKIDIDLSGEGHENFLDAKYTFENKEGGPTGKVIVQMSFGSGTRYVNYGSNKSVLNDKIYGVVDGDDYATGFEIEFLTEPDFYTLGLQTLTIRPILPEGYVLGEGVASTYTYKIYVRYGGSMNGTGSWSIQNGELVLSGYDCAMPNYDNSDSSTNKVPWYEYRDQITSFSMYGFTTLGTDVFEGTNIAFVSIPDEVTSINARAFRNMPRLESVSYYGDSFTCSGDYITNLSNTQILLYADKVYVGEHIIPEGINYISDYAFADSNITSVKIPSSVTYIGAHAFSGCDNLTIKAKAGSYAYNYAKENGFNLVTEKETLVRVIWPDDIEIYLNEEYELPIIAHALTSANTLVELPVVFNGNTNVATDVVGTSTIYGSLVLGEDFVLADGYSTEFSIDINVLPYEGNCGDNLTWTYDGKGTLTITGSGEMDALPESLKPFYEEITTVNLPEGLTNIPDDAFSGMTELSEIDIPETVTSIGICAFADTKITSLHIPSNVEEILPEAFLGSSIEEFTVSAENQYFCAEDGVLFNKDKTVLVCYPPCKEGEEYTVPESVTTIEVCAFLECKYLEKLNIGENVTMMQDCGLEDSDVTITAPEGSYALEYAKNNNVKYYEIPTLVTTETYNDITWNLYSDGTLEFICNTTNGKPGFLWSTMWRNKQDLVKTLKIEEGLISGYNDKLIFDGFPNLETVYIPSTYTSSNLIANCPSVKNFIVAEGNPNYFVQDGNLCYRSSNGRETLKYFTDHDATSYTFPENLEGFSGDAFIGATELEVMNIPATVSYLDERYLGMPSLREFNVAEGNSAYYSDNGVLYNKNKTQLYRMPVSSAVTEYTVLDTATSIYGSAFENCKNIKSVSMSDSVQYLNGHYTFANAKNLESVRLSDILTSIPNYTFNECEKLAIVNIPAKATYIGEYAFCKTAISGELVIPEGITWIGDEAFSEISITSVTIPGTVENLQNRIFYNCDSLETAIIEEGVTYIYGNIFCYCDNLKNVTLPTSLTRLGEGVFKGCTGLETITIPSASIGFEAFKNCDSLKTVVLGNGVTSIAREAFYNCQNLETINLPEGLTRIENNAFYSCGIKEITIPSTVTYMTNYMFNGCQELERITINSNADIPANAFTGLGALYYLTINGSPSNIAANAFKNCDALREVNIPSSVTDFNATAFYSCDDLEIVRLNEGTTSISGAFTGCGNLSYIYIPDSVTSIADGCFSACPNVTIVANKDTYAETFAKENNINFEVIKIKIVKIDQYEYIREYYEMNVGSYIYIPHGQLVATTEKGDLIYVNVTLSEEMDTSYAHTQEILVTVEVPYGYELAGGIRESFTIIVETIATSVSGDCGKTKEDNVVWTIEDTILTISGEGEMADYSTDKGCEAPWSGYAEEISLVVIENGVKNIGAYAFAGLYNTQQISIANTVSSIGEGAFTGSAFVDVTLPLLVTRIPNYAFMDASVSSITFNGKITYVGDGAFYGCKGFRSVVFAGTQEEWNSIVFDGKGNESIETANVKFKLPSTASAVKVDEKAGTVSLDVVIPEKIVEQVREEGKDAKVLIIGMGVDAPTFNDYDLTGDDASLENVEVVGEGVTTVKVFIWDENLRPLSEPEIITIRKSGK